MRERKRESERECERVRERESERGERESNATIATYFITKCFIRLRLKLIQVVEKRLATFFRKTSPSSKASI